MDFKKGIKLKVLIVDDEEDFLEQAKLFLKKVNEDLEVETATSAEEALERLEDEDYDVAVTDYRMPGMNGLELMEKARSEGISVPIVMVTGKGDEEVAMHSINLGAEGYYTKQGKPKELFGELAKAIEDISDRRRGDEYLVAWIGKDAPVQRFATENLVGVDKDTSVQKATQRMVELGIDSLVVLDDSEIVGFFTDGDIQKKVTAEGLKPDLPVEEIMETDLITVDATATLDDAIELMSEHGIKHLLTEKDGEIDGILTLGDILGIDRHRLETYISRE